MKFARDMAETLVDIMEKTDRNAALDEMMMKMKGEQAEKPIEPKPSRRAMEKQAEKENPERVQRMSKERANKIELLLRMIFPFSSMLQLERKSVPMNMNRMPLSRPSTDPKPSRMPMNREQSGRMRTPMPNTGPRGRGY